MQHTRDEFGYLSLLANAYHTAAINLFNQGNEEESWYRLVLKEYYRYGNPYDRTERQKEVQKLWIQRGLLERAKANLILIVGSKQPKEEFFHLMYAIEALKKLIEHNHQLMTTVKNRIPK